MKENETYTLNGVTIKDELLRLAEYGNKPFTESLHPGVEHVLGIRVPDLRRLATSIVSTDWQWYLDTADTYYMEERMLQGLVLGTISPDALSIEDYLSRVTQFVRVINSWSVCDTFGFAGGQRFVASHEERIWKYLCDWMHASKEYEIRFGVVMSMKYFIDDKHLSELIYLYDQIHHDGYYVKMAVAWALSVCFVKYPEVTMDYLRHNQLDDFTYHKTLQKIVESYRVASSVKEQIKQMKRK